MREVIRQHESKQIIDSFTWKLSVSLLLRLINGRNCTRKREKKNNILDTFVVLLEKKGRKKLHETHGNYARHTASRTVVWRDSITKVIVIATFDSLLFTLHWKFEFRTEITFLINAAKHTYERVKKNDYFVFRWFRRWTHFFCLDLRDND